MDVNEAKKIFLQALPELSEPLKSAVKFTLSNWHKLSCDPSKIDDLPQEVWRDVIGYEGIYQVSNMGRVKSLHWLGGRLIKLSSNKKGYLSVGLSKNNVTKNNKVHILVARAFLPNHENKPIVHHKDGNRKNNHLENLEWATHLENQQYSIQMGTKKFPLGIEFNNAKLTEDDVRYIRAHFIPYDNEFGNSAIAKKFNVSSFAIYDVIHGRSYKNVI